MNNPLKIIKNYRYIKCIKNCEKKQPRLLSVYFKFSTTGPTINHHHVVFLTKLLTNLLFLNDFNSKIKFSRELTNIYNYITLAVFI